MMQGDRYNLRIKIVNNAASDVTPDDVSDVEITVGLVSKKLSDKMIRFKDGYWLYPMEQMESSDLLPGPVKAQVRVRWKDGSVEGTQLKGIRVQEGLSKEVL